MIPAIYRVHRDPGRQVTLFPDYAGQVEPPDDEPVFALAGTTSEPEDDDIRPGAPDSFEA